MILVLGSTALAMFLVVDRVHQRYSAHSRIDGAVHSMQTDVALTHLWVEEYVTGDLVEVSDIHRILESAMQRLDSIDEYAASRRESGVLGVGDRAPLVESLVLVRAGLVSVTEISEQRIVGFQRGDTVGIGSATDVEMDARFASLLGHLSDLSSFIGAALDALETRRILLLRAINIAWVLAIGLSVMGMWHRERLRMRAESSARESEAHLLQAQKMEAVGRLANGIAHDVNNHLAAVITQCEVAKLRTVADDPIIARLNGIIATSEKSATLIRRLLSFSRRQPFKPKVIELNSAVEELTKMVSRLIGDDIQLNIFCGAGPNNVLMDPAHIEQILLNLVLNSRDALPSGGTIEIHVNTATRDDCISLRVTDDGVGIPEEILEKIFEPFFTTKSEAHNSGIGLTTVHNIVTQNGGEISVSSPQHEGTVFTILLPRTEQVQQETSAGKISPIACRSKQSGILFVDDNAELRKSTSEILDLLGYHVWSAPDGNAALQTYEDLRDSVSLLITDVVMPALGGEALASRLREERPSLPVIFISGQGIEALRGAPTNDSHTVFLAKPFTVEQLATAIEDVLPYT